MSESTGASTFTYRFGDRITIENTDRLMSEITSRFDSPSVQRIIFDVENVRECSSCGLRLFLYFQRRADAAGRTLVLFRASPVLRDLLSTTRLDKVFTLSDTSDED